MIWKGALKRRRFVKRTFAYCLALLLCLATAYAQSPETERVSVDSSGNEANAQSYNPSISSDGRYVAFESWATNLVPDDNNYMSDIFVRDRDTDTTTRVSVDSDGNDANGSSWSPSISSDGRYVAFVSGATDLVPDDGNNMSDIFVHDLQTGTTTLVSVASDGTQGDSGSNNPSISSDGPYVAFESDATNLVADDDNGAWDIFVHDRDVDGDGIFDEPGQVSTTRVSVASSGVQGNGDSRYPSISSDGRYVAFSSGATNLVAGDDNGAWDIFVHDRQTGTTTRVSVDSSGNEGDYGSSSPIHFGRRALRGLLVRCHQLGGRRQQQSDRHLCARPGR